MRLLRSALVSLALLPVSVLAQDASTGSPGEPADWIVTLSGERFEIDGPWWLEGDRVYFRTSGGTLSVIRASEVDLDASRWPEEAPAEPEAESPPPEPVLVLENGAAPQPETSEDAQAGSQRPAESATTEGTAPPDPTPATSSGPDLSVVSWSDVSETGEDVHIFGTLRNNSSRPADRLRVRVRLLDEIEEELATRPARLVRNRVDGGGTVNFQVYFDQFLPYSEVDFVIEGRQ